MRALNRELERWMHEVQRYLSARAESGDPEPAGVMPSADLHAQGSVHLERVIRDLAAIDRVRGTVLNPDS